ncbi:MAG: POTRA domain-containing protein [Rikenellaceae bacterium]
MERRIRLVLSFLVLILSSISTTIYAQERVDSVEVVLPPMDYATPKQYVIEDLKVTGVKYLSPELIIGTTGLQKGDTIYLPSDHITNLLGQMWSQRYYSNVKALVEVEDDKAYIEFVLRERSRVSAWEFTGVKNGEAKELKDEKLKLRERVELSDFALENSKNIIIEYYKDKGFRDVEVEIRQKNDTLLDNFAIVTFDVNKGPKIKIKEISFEGNEALDDSKLKSSLKSTREKTLINLFKSAKFNEKKFAEDKSSLEDYMRSRGYRDGIFMSDSIYKISDNRIGLVVNIEEGQKYYYRDINWVGNVKYPSELLSNMLGIRKGDTYDKLTLDERLGVGSAGSQAAFEGAQNVSTIYQNDGHLTFELLPIEKVVGGDSIDIDIKINEGKQFTINEVSISGNNRTNDRAIRRELYVRPGELYDQSMLFFTIRQLGTMGHFNAEAIMPDIQPVSDQLVNIGFPLEEVQSDQLEVSGGWGSGMFVGSLAVTFNNVSMRKLFEEGAWRPYPSGDNQKLKVSAQSNGSYYKALSLSFVEPWLGGKKPNSLSTSIYYSSQNDSYYYGDESSSYFTTLGAAVGLSKRLKWPDPNFNIMGELSYQAYLLDDWSSFLMQDGVANTIALSGTLMRNSMDQQLYPRSGSEMYLKATVTPPWSSMNNKDYSDEDMEDAERYKWIEYYKITGMARFFHSMLPQNKLVLMARGEFGYLGEYNKYNPSPFEGFTVGGDGVSGYSLYGIENIGLRGYENDALSPYADYGVQARSYVKYTAELRYPVVLSPTSSVYGLVFAEAGNAFYDWKSFNPFDLKRSAGAGVRLYLPIVGMFGIDWAYGFDTAPYQTERSGSQFHFSIGQTF